MDLILPHSMIRTTIEAPEESTHPRTDDRQLIKDSLKKNGFGRLVSTYEGLVYRLAFRFVGNPEDAFDVSQETFLRIHRALPKFRGDSALSTWIYTITANTARNFLRSKKSRERVQVLTFPNQVGDEFSTQLEQKPDSLQKSPVHQVESRALGVRIQNALMVLPEEFREAVILRDMEGLDYLEIAQQLGVKEGTIKSRISRGRAVLRILLKDELSEACPAPLVIRSAI
jgi:RNA polymerase sigma-70 factor (ECF subfamily)